MKADNDNIRESRLPFKTLDALPLFATDREIAVAVVGKAGAEHWRKAVLPTLEAKNSFPKVDSLHKGRPVPLIMRYYQNYMGLRDDDVVRDSEDVEDLTAWTARRRAA